MRTSKIQNVVLAGFVVMACTLAGAAGARTLAAPTITSFSPKSGQVASKVVITGANFTGATVNFAGRQATDVVVNPAGTQIVVTVPSYVADGWSGRIAVTTAEGTVMTPVNFTLNAAPARSALPVIKSFAPLKARIGAKVMIKGSNLGGTQWVKFGGVKATFTVPKSTLIVAQVPKMAHTGRIVIKTATGKASLPRSFKVVGAL
jgi:hypothetical protein